MSYQGYPGYPGEVIDAEDVEVIPAQRSMGTGLLPRSTSVKMSKVIEEAMLLGTRDRCLALLAKAGMEHAAALSVMEAQFSSMTPQAAERYRAIVNAYAQQAMNTIRRW